MSDSPGRPGRLTAAQPTGGEPARGVARAHRLWQGARAELLSRRDLLAVIAAGGAIGSLARWGLSRALPPAPGAFPWATFAANVSGCLLIGALMVLLTDVWPPSRYARPFLAVGVLGGYTTFSTYMVDTRSLLMTGHAALAGAYLVGSLLGGLAAVWLGIVAVRSAIRVARWRRLRNADAVRTGTPQPGDGAAGPSTPSPTRTTP